MIRHAALFAVLAIALGSSALFAEQAQEPVQPQQPEPVPLVEATKQETWTLGDQQWDFKDVASVYQPVKGALNPKTGAAEWTLELVKELATGEVGLHESVEGSPFKPVLLDADKIALDDEPEVHFASKLTGKPGDKVKIVVQLPKAEVLNQAKLIRLQRRTKVGF